MPIVLRGEPAPIQVAPSALFELTWVVFHACFDHEIEGAHASLEPLRRRFGPELARTRGEGANEPTLELVVLANRCGSLVGPDLEDFFAKVGAAAAAGGPLPSLRVEAPQVLEGTRQRLDQLRTDQPARELYVRLLAEIWSAARQEWEDQGLPSVEATVKQWTQDLSNGAPYRQLFGGHEVMPGRPDVDAVIDRAAAEGRLVLTPSWFGGIVHVYELDGWVYVGKGLRAGYQSERELAAWIAASIRTLADPTRVAILVRLAHQPSSVSELARQLGLSQPAVSGHVQILREAGLLDEKTVGRSAILSANEDRVLRLFSEAATSLQKVFRT
jgi:DNA-binding transcriptional ArsR family regulator